MDLEKRFPDEAVNFVCCARGTMENCLSDETALFDPQI